MTSAVQHCNGKIRRVFSQILAVTAKNLLFVSIGAFIAYPTILIHGVQGTNPNETLVLNKNELSWIGSIGFIVLPVGCLLSGIVTQPLGRKRTMLVSNLPMFISWLILHYADRVEHLYLALLVMGFTNGLCETAVITYVAEISEPHLRGSLAASSFVMTILGTSVQFLMGAYLPWRTIALANLAFPLTAFAYICFVPESPYWLVTRGRVQEAQRSLAWLRGWTTAQEVQEEHDEICTNVRKNTVEANKTASLWDDLKLCKKKRFLAPFLLLSYMFFLISFTGINSVQTFAISIFGSLKSPLDPFSATVAFGVMQLAGTVFCVCSISFLGKRLLTLASLVTMGVSFAIITVCAHLIGVKELMFVENPPPGHGDAIQWIPPIGLILCAFASYAGLRLIPWLMLGEVFTGRLTRCGAGFCAAVGSVLPFFSNITFIDLVDLVGLPGVFAIYSIVSLAGVVGLHLFMPETEGRTLADIESHFKGEIDLGQKLVGSKKRLRVADMEVVNRAFVIDDNL